MRGSSKHILDEAERSFHDAICVLVNTIKNSRVLYGGGNSEMRMAAAVDKLAKSVKGKTAIAIEAYARALRQLPCILADNGGFDSSELVQDLKVEIENGNTSMGLNLYEGYIDCMKKLGVTVVDKNPMLILGVLQSQRTGFDVSKRSGRNDPTC